MSDSDDTWRLVERGFSAATAKHFEGLFTLGWDGLHLRGSLEEPLAEAPQNETYWRLPANVTSERMRHALSKWGAYVPGVYGQHPLLNNQLINLPWIAWLTPVIEGERLDASRAMLVHQERALDLRTAVLRRKTVWRTTGGIEATWRTERFVVAGDGPRTLVQRGVLTVNRTCEAAVEAGIDGDVRTNGWDHFTDVAFNPPGDDHASTVAAEPAELGCRVTLDSGETVSVRTILLASGDLERVVDGRRGLVRASRRLPPGESWVAEKRTTIHRGSEAPPAPPDGPYEELLTRHAAAWRERWNRADILIEGDADSQRAIRAAIFHLLRSHPGDSSGLAIDAKGYAGEAYWGRFFWDTEMFLLPFFAHVDPARARTLADFRVASLEGAKRNAAKAGYPGAKYAWESDPAGDECCPNWQYADHEIHVTADVVYGLAYLSRAAGDDAFLRRPEVCRVLAEAARYWMARMDRRPGEDHPSILGVMGPDEYTPLSHNNAYTNRLAAFALSLAAKFCNGRDGVSDAERGPWRDAARSLPIPRRPDDPRLVLQCEDFHRLAPLDFDALWKDRSRTLGSQVPQERLYRSRALKQADVLMLMHLFPREFTDEEVRAAWDFYTPITTHDSSLSAAVHALIALRLGLHDEAWRFFTRSRGIDLDPSHGGGAAEGVHIANAGGLWQVVVHGFAGLESAMHADEITLNPRLPGRWTRLAFPLAWRGSRVFVDARPGEVTVRNVGGTPSPVNVRGDRRVIAPGAAQQWEAAT